MASSEALSVQAIKKSREGLSSRINDPAQPVVFQVDALSHTVHRACAGATMRPVSDRLLVLAQIAGQGGEGDLVLSQQAGDVADGSGWGCRANHILKYLPWGYH